MVSWRGEEALVAVVLVKSGIALVMSSWQSQNWDSINITGCLALQALAVFSFPSPGGREAIQPVLFRPKVYHGMYCVLLVPLAVLPEMGTFSVSGTDIQTDSGSLHSVIFLLEAGSAMLLLAPRMLKVAPGYGFYLLILVSSAVLLPSVFQEGMSITALMVGILVALSAVICFPKMTPKSFTLGELFVVSHLLAHFLWRITRWLEARLFSQTVPSITDGYVYIFMSVMLVFVTVASLPVLLMNAGHHIVMFLLPYAGFAVAALVTLQIITHSNPLLWFLHFLWNTTRIRLLIWWFTLAVLTAVCVTAFTHSSSSRGRSSSARASSSVRKAFHFVVVAVYTPGLAADPQFLLLASVVAFAVLIVLEVARLSKVQMLGPAIEESFQVFADSQDQGRVLLTHIYLLVGLSLPLWLAHGVHAGDLNNYAGVLSLGIGDTFACLFGARYGRTRWPGTDKSLEGTGASILLQFAFIMVIAYLGWTAITSWWSVAFAVIVSSVYEALATQIDNLVLPLVMMAARL